MNHLWDDDPGYRVGDHDEGKHQEEPLSRAQSFVKGAS